MELAEKNPRIVGVTPAMPTGCSMNMLMQAMPDRAFDVGIAEGHAATFSGGMAKEGMQPFCNIYSSFMQRAYDNVIHDIAILKLPVVLCLDRAGLVGEDGPTHHGVFDLAYFISIAHYDLRFLKPLDEEMLHEIGRSFSRIITIEDGIRKGGMGTAILEFMSDNEYTPHVHRIGVPDKFVEHGTIQELYHLCGMDEEGILEAININCHDKERSNKDI